MNFGSVVSPYVQTPLWCRPVRDDRAADNRRNRNGD